MDWTSISAGIVVAMVTGIYIKWKTVQKSKRECGRDYPKDTVILHQFPRGPFAPSMSGFCLKLETFLRMAKIPYQNVHAYKTGPKNKSPWIEYNDTVLGDSQFIMKFLIEKFETDLNKTLTNQQKAMARAIQILVEDHVYWLVLFERWVNHRSETSKTLTKLPAIFVWEIGRRTRNMAHAHGVGRHRPEEVEELLEEDLRALSQLLADKKYMLGDDPTEIDCAVFGQLCQVKYHVPEVVKAKQLLQGPLSNLSEYCDRMKEAFWPDWDECVTNGFTREATK